MDITLDDLQDLEPRLSRFAGSDANVTAGATEKSVSWAVSVRATSPHIPNLRGGEIVLLPSRIAATVGDDLCRLVHHAATQGASAIVFARGDEKAAGCARNDPGISLMEWAGRLDVESEASINRALTECRGALYQIGSELERRMSDVAAGHGGLGELVDVVATASGIPIEVRDSQGRALARARDTAAGGEVEAPDAVPHSLVRDLGSGKTLILGPMAARQRVIARFLVERIAKSTEAAMRRDDAARPRGERRVDAIRALITDGFGGAGEPRSVAAALGLDPDATYLVAIARGHNAAQARRVLALLGEVHEAGTASGEELSLVEAEAQGTRMALPAGFAEARRRWTAANDRSGAALALSGPAPGVAGLLAATQEARFVAGLQQRGLCGQFALFASLDDLGPMKLLYPIRDSMELRQFTADALGVLLEADHRGTLSETLRAFLACGGSHVDAANVLGIHRNTLAYRLRRLSDLIGRDVTNPESWLTLHLASLALNVLDVGTDGS